jgi:hypothetical protein
VRDNARHERRLIHLGPRQTEGREEMMELVPTKPLQGDYATQSSSGHSSTLDSTLVVCCTANLGVRRLKN